HAVFQALAEHEQISPLNRAFVLAQLHESIDNHVAADEFFRRAVKLADEQGDAGERLVVLERVAQYFRRFDAAFAEECCRRALSIDASSIGPQQILLELLLAKRTREAAAEARQMVES